MCPLIFHIKNSGYDYHEQGRAVKLHLAELTLLRFTLLILFVYDMITLSNRGIQLLFTEPISTLCNFKFGYVANTRNQWLLCDCLTYFQLLLPLEYLNTNAC